MSQSQSVRQRAQNEPISTTVVDAVAEFHGVGPVEVPPLYRAIDPDALNSLFGRSPLGGNRFEGKITFELAECEVEVQSDRTVSVSALDVEAVSTATEPTARADAPTGE